MILSADTVRPAPQGAVLALDVVIVCCGLLWGLVLLVRPGIGAWVTQRAGMRTSPHRLRVFGGLLCAVSIAIGAGLLTMR